MVTDEVWNAAWPTGRGMLCIGCLEDRLGRQLTSDDFTDAPINQGVFGYSERLRQRLAGSIPTSNEALIKSSSVTDLAQQLPTSNEPS